MSDSSPYNHNDDFALERMNHSKFYLSYVTRRPSQAPNFFVDWTKLELPTQSTLHTLNGFDTLVPNGEGMPDATNPLVNNEKFPIFLKINSAVAHETSRPLAVSDSFIYRPNTLLASAAHFYQTHHHFRRIMSDRTIGSMQGVLTWVDYSPLNELKVNGSLNAYRKFDILFRTILDKVVEIGAEKHHYIALPQGDKVFGRPVLQRCFKELSVSTLTPLAEDPSIFPVLHILGLVYGKLHPQVVTPYRTDAALLGKDAPLFAELSSTSLLERLPTEMYDSINFIFYKGDKAVIYNLGNLLQFAEDASFYPKLYRHLMSLRVNGAVVPDHIEVDSEQFDTLVTSLSGEKVVDEPDNKVIVATDGETTQKDNAPVKTTVTAKAVIAPVTAPEAHPVAVSDSLKGKSLEDKIRTTVATKTQTEIGTPEKIKTKRQQLIENHFNVSLGGKSLGELISAPHDIAIRPKSMDFLDMVPDESYQSSSLAAMDRIYQKHGYKQELAKVLASLAKHGLYITKLEESRVNTEMDRTITYKAVLQDEDGRSHHLKFTVPDINEDGMMQLSGTEYRLTRQIANVPICKISPTRVNLSSYYNKIIVERIQSKRNSFEQDMTKLILTLKANAQLDATSGTAPAPTRPVPYDYSAIGSNFTDITVGGYHFYFDGNGASPDHNLLADTKRLTDLETRYGTLVGQGPEGSLLFWDTGNQIHQVNRKDVVTQSWISFTHLLVDQIGADALPDKTSLEWTQANILNQTIPLVYILSFKLGLKRVLDLIKLDYKFYPTGTRPVTGIMDISVKFADGVLVFNRYPLSRSLIATGLNWVKLNDVYFNDMNLSDTYTRIFAKKDMSVGVLKGLTGFFDFFVDPITESVLEKMGEPITFPELLLRANIMLTDYHALESSSVSLHRFRLYERFNGIVYNEIYRGLANYRNNPATKKAFSINPEAVFQKIVQDATISPNDVINPVHEAKQRANFTFTGSGGRTPNSFVMKDRIYPKDGLGVISESVPDSGKVGITAYLSASPRIDDIHGLAKPHDGQESLTPPQILSIGSMVMPGGTVDDGKRNNYLSIQISHYVPNHGDGETLAVRTGYDAVLPHLTSKTFAIAAEDDGIVESIDEKHQVIKVRYKEQVIPVLRSQKLNYLDQVLTQYRDAGHSVGLLIPEAEIGQYPIGGVLSLTKTVNGKIVDRLRCESVDAIPDKDAIRKQNNLVQDLIRGRYPALYYIRLMPIGTKMAGVTKSFSYKDEYSPVSGAYLLQKRVPNVKVGESFKRGDLLAYNPGFFVSDPFSKQATFKHGVVGIVALVEKSSNHEDACEISKSLSKRLMMTPCHQREVVTKKDAAVLAIVKVGDHVETSDNLCVISDEYLISSGNVDMENLDIMEKLNRQTPSAGYTGTISKVRILYSCKREELSESLKSILKHYEKATWDNFKALSMDANIAPPDRPGWVEPGTKYKGIDFTDDTVLLEFMIQEELAVAEGDKICISNAAKSIISHVSEQQHYTESGIPVDILFSTTSVVNRIILSPMFVGLAERNMDKLKENILEMYFDK